VTGKPSITDAQARSRARGKWILIALSAWIVLLAGVAVMLLNRYASLGDPPRRLPPSPRVDEDRRALEGARKALLDAQRLLASLEAQAATLPAASLPGTSLRQHEVEELQAIYDQLVTATQAADRQYQQAHAAVQELERASAVVGRQNEDLARQLERAKAEVQQLEAQARARGTAPATPPPVPSPR
jgi:hypothetical protein